LTNVNQPVERIENSQFRNEYECEHSPIEHLDNVRDRLFEVQSKFEKKGENNDIVRLRKTNIQNFKNNGNEEALFDVFI